MVAIKYTHVGLIGEVKGQEVQLFLRKTELI